MRRLALLILGAVSWASAADLTVLEPGSAAQLTALGNEVLVQGRFETAIEHYRKALAVDKDAFPALFNLALANQQLGQRAEARRWYEEALRVRPNHAEALCNLGVLALADGDAEGAVVRFEEAARLSVPQSEEAADYWYNAGTARERLAQAEPTQWSKAQRAYQECLALNGAHVGGHYNLANVYLGPLAADNGALAKAEAHLRKAHEVAPDNAAVLVNLALTRERAGGDDAGSYFDQAIACASGPVLVQALWARAQFANRANPPRKVAMRDDLVRLLGLDSAFPGANGLLGAYYTATADYDKAVAHLEREVAGNAYDANSAIDRESHYLLAMIYTDHRPDPAQALAHATAYYQAQPDSRKIHQLRRRALGAGQPAVDLSAPTPGHAAAATAAHAATASSAESQKPAKNAESSGHASAHKTPSEHTEAGTPAHSEVDGHSEADGHNEADGHSEAQAHSEAPAHATAPESHAHH